MTARVELIDPVTAEGDLANFFEATKQFRGRIPNSARAWAHIPHIGKLFLALGAALQREGAGGVLTCKLKEMCIIKTSQINNCNY